jgi:asparagine synthase (glutamine-hydrolysing)
MCGIAGFYNFSDESTIDLKTLSARFRKQLGKRGPDSEGEFITEKVLLSHTRLSVIDTSAEAGQPMFSKDGSCVIVYNGEIFNFKSLRQELEAKGNKFETDSDTEVILQLYLEEGLNFLNRLNGFFSLAIYNKSNDELIIARDRFGIKPLLFSQTEKGLVFASEMKALLEALEPQELDHASLRMYFRLTYIPQPYTIFKNIQKLVPGCYLIVNSAGVKRHCYATIVQNRYRPNPALNYTAACSELYNLMEESVKNHLISDVPLGCFLSGGTDSSIVAALASKHTGKLRTFSVGFKDEPYYDETYFAGLVARKLGTEHISFILSNDEMFQAVESMLDYIDEPFADSSALAVYILAHQTRKYVTVALSGDGADEMFGGYNKHVAEYRIRQGHMTDKLLLPSAFLWDILPASRSGRFPDKVRKIRKYLRLLKLPAKERYRELLSFNDIGEIEKLIISYGLHDDYLQRWNILAAEIEDNTKDIEDVLLADMNNVLPGDMLPKVDSMSMSHSLEVRPPFLDNNVVDFAFSIPTEFKIYKNQNKRILRDTFSKELPAEVLNRPKHGFEVPMNKWFRAEMRPMIDKYLQSREFIQEQKLFRHDVINELSKKVLNSEFHDLQSFIWSLIVFQKWYEKYEMHIKKDWF